MTRPEYPTLLDCLHTILLAPAPEEGDEVLCRRCNAYRFVVVIAVEWGARCWGCTYSRRFGADEAGARLKASRHASQYTHTVSLKCGGKSVELIQPPGVDAYVPRHARNPEHQEGLRAYVLRNTVTKP